MLSALLKRVPASEHSAFGVAIAVVVISFCFGCAPEVPERVPAQSQHDLWRVPEAPAAPPALSEERLREPLEPCRRLVPLMRQAATSRGIDCSRSRSQGEAIECMNRAIELRQPFTFCQAGYSMDSHMEHALVGSSRDVLFLYFDTEGPQYQGLCLRPSVIAKPRHFPSCKGALIERVDLRGKVPEESAYP